MYPYPARFTDVTEEVSVTVNILKGKFPGYEDGFHALWSLTGFAATQIAPTPPQPGVLQVITEEQAVAHLETALAPGVKAMEAAAQIPWQVILPILLDQLRKWIERRNPPPAPA